MSKKLVACFSASGVTMKVAQRLADALGADLFEITPLIPYTQEDLNWRDKNSRSSLEMKDASSRPALAAAPGSVADYEVVYVGFPIWWYVAPTIINTYLESLDLKGKTLVPFATSGGSGMGQTNEALLPSCPGAKLAEGKVFSPDVSREELAAWGEPF